MEYEDDRREAISIITQHLEDNFIHDSTFEIDEMLLTHFPLSVEPITEIVMLPSRICDEQNDECVAHYQPCVEAHSWKLLQIAQGFICRIESISKHLSRSSQLRCVVNSDDFLTNLMKMYKHISAYDLTRSALVVQYSSSLATGLDWGCFLSGLVQAKHLLLETLPNRSVEDFHDLLRVAMNLAGIEHQKVVLHIDSTLVYFNNQICETLIKILQQDSVSSLLQFLQLPYVHKTVKEGHKDMFIQSGSMKEMTLSKIFLENVQRNLKIFITVNKNDIKANENVRRISEWFLLECHGYLVIDDDDVEWYKESLNYMLPMLTRSYSGEYKIVADFHKYFENSFTQYVDVFGAPFRVNGRHLQLSMTLYSFLLDYLTKKKQAEIDSCQMAIDSVDRAHVEMGNLKLGKGQLQEGLVAVSEEINRSSMQLKNMKESYGKALVECKHQEKFILDLKGPFDNLAEKSKSNLNDVRFYSFQRSE